MAQDKAKPKDGGGGKPQGKVQGEGDYEAGRRYDEKAREFAQRGDVEQAARDAEPQSRGEERELEQAEEKGRQRAKEEDRLLNRPQDVDPGKDGGKG